MRFGPSSHEEGYDGTAFRPCVLRETLQIDGMPAKLSTHVLDLTRGAPAAGMEIELWNMGEPPQRLKAVTTNVDGRTDEPLLTGADLHAGDFQLVFKIRDYFARRGVDSTFFVHAAVFFRIEDPTASYHVPLLVTPWAYNTYRGN